MFRKKVSFCIWLSLLTLLPLNTTLFSGKIQKMAKSYSVGSNVIKKTLYCLTAFIGFKILYDFFNTTAKDSIKVNGVTISVVTGDITKQKSFDYLVNSANEGLLQGGGVCGAIFRAAGRELHDECKKALKKLKRTKVKVANAVVTGGGKLPKKIIHVVPPNFNPKNRMQQSTRFDGRGKGLLSRSYASGLKLAKGKVAVPFLSSGNFMKSKKDRPELARVAAKAVVEAVKKNKDLQEVRFVVSSNSDRSLFIKELKRYSGKSKKK